MRRTAHHRTEYRLGPEHRWVRRKAYHLAKFGGPGFVGRRIRQAMRTISPGVYAIPAGLVLEWRQSLDDFEPYATDTDGSVWE